LIIFFGLVVVVVVVVVNIRPWNACYGNQTHVRLIDAPGLHDSNTERAQTLSKVLSSADAILLVSNARRAINDKTTQDAIPLSVREHLIDKGQRIYL
jgi:predicted GTPase